MKVHSVRRLPVRRQLDFASAAKVRNSGPHRSGAMVRRMSGLGRSLQAFGLLTARI